MVEDEPKALQIATFNPLHVAASLDVSKVEEVVNSRPEVKGLPTIVISVGGVARSGKSFLLNLLVSYLNHTEVVSLVVDCPRVFK